MIVHNASSHTRTSIGRLKKMQKRKSSTDCKLWVSNPRSTANVRRSCLLTVVVVGMPDNNTRLMMKRSARLLGYKPCICRCRGKHHFDRMSRIENVTGTVVNITHHGDTNINLDDDEFDDLFTAVNKSAVMSPARKKAYDRLEFLERKEAKRKAETKQATNGRYECKKAKQAATDSQVGIGAQLFCPLDASKRLEKVAKSFYAATTQMKPENHGSYTGRYNTATADRPASSAF